MTQTLKIGSPHRNWLDGLLSFTFLLYDSASNVHRFSNIWDIYFINCQKCHNTVFISNRCVSRANEYVTLRPDVTKTSFDYGMWIRIWLQLFSDLCTATVLKTLVCSGPVQTIGNVYMAPCPYANLRHRLKFSEHSKWQNCIQCVLDIVLLKRSWSAFQKEEKELWCLAEMTESIWHLGNKWKEQGAVAASSKGKPWKPPNGFVAKFTGTSWKVVNNAECLRGWMFLHLRFG